VLWAGELVFMHSVENHGLWGGFEAMFESDPEPQIPIFPVPQREIKAACCFKCFPPQKHRGRRLDGRGAKAGREGIGMRPLHAGVRAEASHLRIDFLEMAIGKPGLRLRGQISHLASELLWHPGIIRIKEGNELPPRFRATKVASCGRPPIDGELQEPRLRRDLILADEFVP
jgi:hypothetical protein